MREYINLVGEVLNDGLTKGDRTGTGTIAKFGHQMRFDMADGFPLLTTKKLHIRSIIHELLWMLNGDTNIKYLNDNGVRIWDNWTNEKGELGRVYGAQYRNWNGHIDQIQNIINILKEDPESRRMVITAWNPSDLDKQALACCHCMYQLYAREIKDWETPFELEKNPTATHELSLQVYIRSQDLMLGFPYNIASYSFLLHMFAQVANMIPRELIWTGGDCHIYNNHIKAITEQCKREPRPLPDLELRNRGQSIFEFEYDDFKITDYNPHPHIKAEIAV